MTQATSAQPDQPQSPPPALVQPSGLDVFDFQIKATPLVITWNKDALSKAVDQLLVDYKDVTVTVDMVPAIKAEMAGLNKVKERMDAARKDIVNKINAPLDAFDKEVRAIIKRVTETRGKLDEQVKDWEKRDREGRRRHVQFMIDTAVDESGVPGLTLPLDERWLNKTSTTAKIAAELSNLVLKARQEYDAAAKLERARQDRITIVGEKIKAETERRGFDLPMGKFAPCLSLDMAVDEVALYIAKAFEAEAEIRARQAAAPPQRTGGVGGWQRARGGGSARPPDTEPPQREAPAAPADDAFAMPTFRSAPTQIPAKRILALTLSYDPALEAEVLAIIDRLRDFAAVEML